MGPVYPTASVEGYLNGPFGVVSVGYMRNIPGSPIWMGPEGAVGAAVRKVLEPLSESSDEYASCRTVSFCFAVDVAFWRWNRGEAFVGTGLGVAQRASFDPALSLDDVLGPCVNPRFGVVLWDRMKVSLEGRFTHGYYSTVGMRIGYCF